MRPKNPSPRELKGHIMNSQPCLGSAATPPATAKIGETPCVPAVRDLDQSSISSALPDSRLWTLDIGLRPDDHTPTTLRFRAQQQSIASLHFVFGPCSSPPLVQLFHVISRYSTLLHAINTGKNNSIQTNIMKPENQPNLPRSPKCNSRAACAVPLWTLDFARKTLPRPRFVPAPSSVASLRRVDKGLALERSS